MIKYIQIVSLAVVALLLNACELSNKPAKGSEDEIIVVADSAEYSQLEPELKAAFERTIHTPQPEKLFTLKRISINQIEDYQNSKNIILIGTNNSDNVTSKFIKALIDTASSKGINTVNIIMKNDLWAKNQLIVAITGDNLGVVKDNIIKQGDNIVYSFHQLSDKRLAESLYNSNDEQKDLEGKLLNEYGWIIYVHQDFRLAKDDKENNFVKLSCAQGDDMHRWIFVHWIDNASPKFLIEDSIKAIRNRITNKYYRPKGDASYITLSEDKYMASEIDFHGRYGIITQGIWNLNSNGMEGPFVNYTIFDEKTRRIYMLDGSIYAPKYYKRNLLQQLDVFLQSFMTANDLSPERKQELINSAK